jgi:hypothetical protein
MAQIITKFENEKGESKIPVLTDFQILIIEYLKGCCCSFHGTTITFTIVKRDMVYVWIQGGISIHQVHQMLEPLKCLSLPPLQVWEDLSLNATKISLQNYEVETRPLHIKTITYIEKK